MLVPKVRTCVCILVVATACLSAFGQGAGQAPAAPPTGKSYALVVSTVAGANLYARRYQDWVSRFHSYLTQTAGVPAENVVVLSGDKDFKAPFVRGTSTAGAISQAIDELSKKIGPQDQFILFVVGHGSMANMTGTLLLPGEDMSARGLADALAAIRSENQVILNFAGGSGYFVKELAGANRVNVAATTAGEEVEPVYCEFFLRGLESMRADGSAPLPVKPASAPAEESVPPASAPSSAPADAQAPATKPSSQVQTPKPAPPASPKSAVPPAPEVRVGPKDGVVTVLEAYNWATHQTAMWIMRIKSDGGDWKTEGQESVEIFNKLYGAEPGEPAMRKLTDKADASKPDAVIPLRTTDASQLGPWWMGRRIVNEHAVLEDCGQETAVTALRGKGYEPLDGVKEGQPGNLARRVVLGKASLLPPEEGD